MKKKKTFDMLNGSIWNKLILFALPLAASSILQQLFNAADVAVVGSFAGSGALAAVGANGPIINLLVNSFVGLSIGANVVIASFIGQNDEKRTSLAAHTSILMSVIIGIVLLFVGFFFATFVGFCLGAGMNLTNIAKGGAQGILLGLVTCLIGGAFIVLCDRFISRRPGYAGWAVATTAGNAVAVPAVIAEADPSWAQWADVATSQVAASAILTAILVPIITSWWAKKFGCPKFPKDEAQKALFEKH